MIWIRAKLNDAQAHILAISHDTDDTSKADSFCLQHKLDYFIRCDGGSNPIVSIDGHEILPGYCFVIMEGKKYRKFVLEIEKAEKVFGLKAGTLLDAIYFRTSKEAGINKLDYPFKADKQAESKADNKERLGASILSKLDSMIKTCDRILDNLNVYEKPKAKQDNETEKADVGIHIEGIYYALICETLWKGEWSRSDPTGIYDSWNEAHDAIRAFKSEYGPDNIRFSLFEVNSSDDTCRLKGGGGGKTTIVPHIQSVEGHGESDEVIVKWSDGRTEKRSKFDAAVIRFLGVEPVKVLPKEIKGQNDSGISLGRHGDWRED